MKSNLFTCLLNRITTTLLAMTPAQRTLVQQSIQESQAEISINDIIQPIFEKKSQCPHCHSSRFKKWGKSGNSQRYYCNECGKTFNNRTKTPLSYLHKCELWEQYTHCMSLRLTLREAALICNINLKTAFLWRHRFLTAQSGQYSDKLSGIIEADEFFMAYSEKGNNKLADIRLPRRRGGQIDRGTNEGKVTVLLSIDRSNHMIDGVLENNTCAEIQEHLEPYITEKSVLCSDGAWAYIGVAKHKNCMHKRLKTSGNRVLEGVYHIQTVNGAIAHFKGWVDVKMRGVATKYLLHYLAWFRQSSAKLDKRQILVAAYC